MTCESGGYGGVCKCDRGEGTHQAGNQAKDFSRIQCESSSQVGMTNRFVSRNWSAKSVICSVSFLVSKNFIHYSIGQNIPSQKSTRPET